MGGGGGTTTNVTNTGLGDDQYQSLYDNQGVIKENQGNIASSLDAQREEAKTAYDTMFGRLDTQDTAMGNISNAIGSQGYTYDFSNFGGAPSIADSIEALKMGTGQIASDLKYDVNGDGVVNDADAKAMMSMNVGITPENTKSTGLYAQFDQQNKNLTDQFGNVTTQFGDLTRDLGNQSLQIQNNLGSQLDTLGTNMGGRFDTVDQANTNLQSSVDSGFQDQSTAMNELEAGITSQFDTANSNMSQGFTDQASAMDAGFTSANDALTNTQANILEGQGGLQTNLDTLSGNVDTYATTSLANQEALQQGQDGFQSSFDNYVDRYSDDVTLANQTRADLATAQANATDRLREDMGKYAQAAATGQSALSDQITGSADAAANAFGALSNTVEGGFSAASTDAQQAQTNLATRLGTMRDKLMAQGDTLDANSKAAFDNIASSFDAQGNLITNSIDAQGNTITRQMDDQGNLITSKFDAQGRQIGTNATNLNDALTQAENALSGNMDAGFQTLAAGNQGLMSELQDNRTASREQMEAAMGQMDANQTSNLGQFDQLAAQMQGGFQNMDVNSINQAKDLAAIAATQSDLDMGMRQNFNQLSNAFDENGQLIANSVDEQGNTLSRAIDANGNLLLRSFDATGNEIGNKVININRSLNDLSNLGRVTGSNASMGNLSPASQGAVPTGGFMSPFTMTQ